jgi:hypothetical protein
LPEEFDFSGYRGDNPHGGFDESAFAGAVGSDDSHDFPLWDREGDIPENGGFIVVDSELMDFNSGD